MPELEHSLAHCLTMPEAKPFEYDAEKHIVIGKHVYEREAFSDEHRAAITHINFADQEMATGEQNLRIYRAGRDAMVKLLLDRIEEDKIPFVAEVADPEPEE